MEGTVYRGDVFGNLSCLSGPEPDGGELKPDRSDSLCLGNGLFMSAPACI
jgi:hypothetical protein